MSQADGKNELKRFTLQLKRDGKNTQNYNFLINPQEYEESHPQRTTVFKTREAVIVEDFGPALGTITFSGTTGFKKMKEPKGSGGKRRTGAQRLFALQKFIDNYAKSGYTTEPGGNPNNAELIFYNRTDNKSWYVHLAEDGLSISRSAEESLLYRYSLSLIILRKGSEIDDRDKDEPDIGQPAALSNYKTSTHYINQAILPSGKDNVYKDVVTDLEGVSGNVDPDGEITMQRN